MCILQSRRVVKMQCRRHLLSNTGRRRRLISASALCTKYRSDNATRRWPTVATITVPRSVSFSTLMTPDVSSIHLWVFGKTNKNTWTFVTHLTVDLSSSAGRKKIYNNRVFLSKRYFTFTLFRSPKREIVSKVVCPATFAHRPSINLYMINYFALVGRDKRLNIFDIPDSGKLDEPSRRKTTKKMTIMFVFSLFLPRKPVDREHMVDDSQPRTEG